MKNLKTLTLVFLTTLLLTGCFEDNDDNTISANEISDFVWKGMNVFYLYKDNIPVLANDRFSSNEEYASYLNDYATPEDLFESLIYQRQNVDKYSWIVDDYIALEQLFSGVSTSNGMEFQLFLEPNTNTQVMGIVRLVLPNSDAAIKGIKRGDIFNTINGTALTTTNYSALLSTDSYAINKATYDDKGTPETTDDVVISGNESITLNKLEYSENPIYKTEILNVGGNNVGYLMYNGFIPDFNSQLNSVFANFEANNVQHLVLDLRYNPGGSVASSILLASLVTGQFTGDVHSREQWNSEIQEAFFNQNPENLINRFPNTFNGGTSINSLFLNKAFTLASLPSNLSLVACNTGMTDVYINGEYVMQFNNFLKNDPEVKISETLLSDQAMKLLKLGVNQISLKFNFPTVGTPVYYYDFGIKAY